MNDRIDATEPLLIVRGECVRFDCYSAPWPAQPRGEEPAAADRGGPTEPAAPGEPWRAAA